LLSVLFVNPNFLILDEPTNDLDLQTLRTLEEFLLDFPGCILIVSHDRYFMDRLVDHLFAFEGDGVIRDYPGNYTLYREFLKNQAANPVAAPKVVVEEKKEVPTTQNIPTTVKLSFKEKHELEQLDKEMPLLQKEKEALTLKMNDAGINYDELQKIAARVTEIIELLDINTLQAKKLLTNLIHI
jgi:ATP-binding cassette subfamily F protein uup